MSDSAYSGFFFKRFSNCAGSSRIRPICRPCSGQKHLAELHSQNRNLVCQEHILGTVVHSQDTQWRICEGMTDDVATSWFVIVDSAACTSDAWIWGTVISTSLVWSLSSFISSVFNCFFGQPHVLFVTSVIFFSCIWFFVCLFFSLSIDFGSIESGFSRAFIASKVEF